MTVSELIVEEAVGRGLRHYFGLPGSGDLMDIMEAGRTRGLNFVSTAHESTAAIAAAYYGHLTGSAGLAIAIKGPGAAALASGAAVAHFERKPVVCLCESVPEESPKYLAQKCDHSGLFRSVVKHSDLITPANAESTVPIAFARARSYPPGPVLVDLPSGTACLECKASSIGDDFGREAPAEPPSADIRKANDFLSGMKQPVVLIGSEAARAGAAGPISDLVDRLGAVVLLSMDARGVYDETAERFAGVYAGLTSAGNLANRILAEADGVIVIGFDALMTEGPWIAAAPTLEIHACPDLPDLSRPHIRLNGNIAEIVAHLSAMERGSGYPLDLASAIRRETHKSFERPAGARLAVQDVIEVSKRILPRDGILLSETGVFVLMLEYLWPVSRPDTFFGTTAGRTMGMMIPALMGGKLARPNVPMMGIGADGSTLMRLGEFEVFARCGIAAPIVIVNDSALGTIKSRQKSKGLVPYGLDLGDVDFAGVARAVGIYGVRVETPEQFEKELESAFKADRATVIDVRVDGEPYRDSFGPTIESV